MINSKKAIIFPDFEEFNTKEPISIYSEKSISIMQNTFSKTNKSLRGVTGYIVNRNKTKELGKQLGAQKEAFTAQIEYGKERLRIEYEEKIYRLKELLDAQEKAMELETQRLKLEMSEKAEKFGAEYEKHMKSSRVLISIITSEKKFLEASSELIEKLPDDIRNRKEYIMYCDLQRQSLDIINRYLKAMV